MIYTCTFQGVI